MGKSVGVFVIVACGDDDKNDNWLDLISRGFASAAPMRTHGKRARKEE